MSRIETREAVMKFIYQVEIRSCDYMDLMKDFKENQPEISEDFEYFYNASTGVLDNKEDLDSKYVEFLKNWKLDRLSILDKIILEIAVFEILNCEDIPTSVSINEAVKLAKKYGTDKSSSFINGVLSSFEKSL